MMQNLLSWPEVPTAYEIVVESLVQNTSVKQLKQFAIDVSILTT